MTVATTLLRLSARDAVAITVALLTVLVAFWILIVSLTRVVVLVDEPFPGILANHRLVVTNTGQYDWTGSVAGLKSSFMSRRQGSAPPSASTTVLTLCLIMPM